MKFLTLQEIAKRAQINLDKNKWDYLIGGSDTESAVRRNRYGLDSWVFRPRILNDVSNVQIGTTLLGSELRIPVLMPPIGPGEANPSDSVRPGPGSEGDGASIE